MKSTFKLNIVTPVNTLSFNDVEYLRAPSVDGLFGVMPKHITSIIALDIGEIKIKKSDKIFRFSTSGGYADINSEKVILVLETVEKGHDIDSKRAKKSIERATKHLTDKSSDINRAINSIKKAKNRIAVSKKSIK